MQLDFSYVTEEWILNIVNSNSLVAKGHYYDVNILSIYFSNPWKLSVIEPIAKKNKPVDFTDLRPIAFIISTIVKKVH